jgi:hypothetical protein
MHNTALSVIASVLGCLPVSTAAEQGQVLTGKDTADNIEIRLVAAKVSETRGQNLLATFVPLKGEQKEVTVKFPAHSHTTHETTLINIIYSSTAPDRDLSRDLKAASLEVVFSVPKDFLEHPNDLSRWYLVSVKVRDKK